VSEPVRVFLLDDHEVVRRGLRDLLESAGGIEVVGEAGTADEALRRIPPTAPDVAILDVRLPDGNGLQACREIRAGDDELGIVVLTMYAGDDTLFEALDAGASAFVPKNAPSEDVVAAARHAASAPRAFTAADLNEAMKRKLSPTGPQLSPREAEVLGLLADGLGVAQISKKLFISESTTKTHISKLYDKLGAGNRAQALMTALRLGLLKRDEPGL
jgi:DNA-binding NarL/FixJ family response regulator